MHVGTNVLTTSENKLPLTGQNGLYASTALDKNKNEIILKIANTSMEVRKVTYTFNGLKKAERVGTHTLLISEDMDAENTLENPTAIIPKENEIKTSGNTIELELAPQSFNLLTIKL